LISFNYQEEEERKKKAKEEQGRKVADDAKRLADEKKRQENVPANKKSNQVKQMNKKPVINKLNLASSPVIFFFVLLPFSICFTFLLFFRVFLE
jgi:hypothetical protein